MAEFCKECFKRSVLVPSDNVTDDMLVMSEVYDICEGCGEYKQVVVKVKFVEEELQEYNMLITDINTYAGEYKVKFILGNESLDNFDKYMETLKSLGIERCIELQQAAYDRYIGK